MTMDRTMAALGLAALLVAGCSVRLGLPIARVSTVAPVQVSARVALQPVAPDGSGVVEFFGIPLESAEDIVFVLDRSGSMDARVYGLLASIAQSHHVPPMGVMPPGVPMPPGAPMPPGVPVPRGAPMPPPVVQPPMPVPRGVPMPGGGVMPGGGTMPPGMGGFGPSVSYGGGPATAEIAVRKIDVARGELFQALARVPDGTRVNVIFFSDALEGHATEPTPLDPGLRQTIGDFLGKVEPWGPTALAPAMRTALLMNPRVVILLSDGLGNVGGDSDDVLRDAREAMLGGTVIHTVGLGADQDVQLLNTLAAESGGLYQRF